MRVVRNNDYIKRRQRGSRLMVWLGVLGLFSSIVMTFYPQLILPAYGVLIFGFIFFNSGMQQLAKWNRRPRPDEMLDDALRRLNDRYTLIHYPNVPGNRPEHVLIFPAGLLVITTRELAGRVRVELNKWRKADRSFLSIFRLGGPQLGNPTAESEMQQQALRSFLEAHDLPGVDLVDGIVVFLNPRAELEVVSSDLTVVKVDELVNAVRDFGTEGLIPAKQRDEIITALSEGEGVEGPISLPTRAASAKRARA